MYLRTELRTDGQHVRKQLSLLWVGRVDQNRAGHLFNMTIKQIGRLRYALKFICMTCKLQRSFYCFDQLIHTAGSDRCFHLCFPYVCPSVRTSVPTFRKLAKQNNVLMFTTGEIVGMAEWIIDDTCLVNFAFIQVSLSSRSSFLFIRF